MYNSRYERSRRRPISSVRELFLRVNDLLNEFTLAAMDYGGRSREVMTANPMNENVALHVAGVDELMHPIANQMYVSDKAPKKKLQETSCARTMMFFTLNIC